MAGQLSRKVCDRAAAGHAEAGEGAFSGVDVVGGGDEARGKTFLRDLLAHGRVLAADGRRRGNTQRRLHMRKPRDVWGGSFPQVAAKPFPSKVWRTSDLGCRP